jgi:hypothetical protein
MKPLMFSVWVRSANLPQAAPDMQRGVGSCFGFDRAEYKRDGGPSPNLLKSLLLSQLGLFCNFGSGLAAARLTLKLLGFSR